MTSDRPPESLDLMVALLAHLIVDAETAPKCCPSCGTAIRTGAGFLIDRGAFDDERHLVGNHHLKPMVWRMLNTLRSRFERHCGMEFLIDGTWGHADTPDDVKSVVRVYINQIRDALRVTDMPYHVHNEWGEGYTLYSGREPAPPSHHNRRKPCQSSSTTSTHS